MKFHEFGNRENPHIMLIHGGGNAWWNYLRQAQILSKDYHVILPTLDGHGEEYESEYVSTYDSAEKLIKYIDENCYERLFLLVGVSLGGQIVLEMLSQRKNIAEKAIIDGSICYPQPMMSNICIMTVKLFSWMMFSEISCKIQVYLLRLSKKMRFPKEIEQLYIQDMPQLKKETLFTMYKTYMNDYNLSESIANTDAEVMYWYGSKEMKCVKKSAQMVKELLPSCKIYEAKGYNHGYLAVYLPDEWIELVKKFILNEL